MTHASSAAVLIVEDELLVANDLQQSLTDMGYDAFAVAASGAEALAHAAKRQPDVVLMDIRIKGEEDGIRTAQRLKQQHPVIVIFLTAFADDQMVDRAKRTEPDGYLLKPVKHAELHSMIEISLYRREVEAEKTARRASEHRLYTITENVPVAIAYFDRKGKVGFANHVFRELVPYRDDPTGVPAMAFLGEDLYKRTYPSRQGAMLGERSQLLLEMDHQGTARKIEVTYFPDHDTGGEVIGVYALGYEVTEREQMSADLRRANTDLETILNAIPAQIASWHLDLTGRFANAAAKSQFGAGAPHPAGSHMRDLFGERRFTRSQPLITAALAGQSVSAEEVDMDGEGTKYRRYTFIPAVQAGAVVGLYTLAFDVTELHDSHEQIRQLARRLDSVREEERRTVAIILHDGIAQDLFAMKLGVDNLMARTQRQRAIHLLCAEIRDTAGQCMQDVRLLANELRPIALKYFDISSVIAEHARWFGTRSKLDIQLSEEPGLPPLEEPMRLLLFRAAQEALTNVARHAGASHVKLTLRPDPTGITLEVIDNGVGITETSLKRPGSLGLLGLRERAVAQGGTLTLERHAPRGTRFAFHLLLTPPRYL